MIEEDKIDKLKKLGIKDSKLLTHKKIFELDKKIRKITKFKILVIKPEEIDEVIESENHMNLNWLEAHKSAEIINNLKPDKVIVDCPSPNINKYKGYLKQLLNNKKIELVVEHKADLNFLIVAASSIIAKATREKEMDTIKKKYGKTGPGYMSNSITQEFLKENWDKHPEIFRKSWISWKNHKNNKEQKKLGEFEK